MEGAWGGPPGEYRESWGQPEAWEEAATHEPPRELGKRSPLTSPPENWGGPTESSQSRRPGTPTTVGWGAEGACPYSHGPERRPELDWRDLLGLLRAPGEGAWARLPRLDWEGLLELLQARLPRKDPAGHRDDLARASGPQMGPPGTKDVPEQESHSQPEGWAEATPVNGHSPAPRPQSLAQPPSPACTSTQWPKTKVTRGPATVILAGLEQTGPLGSRSTAEGPSLPELQVRRFPPPKGSQKVSPPQPSLLGKASPLSSLSSCIPLQAQTSASLLTTTHPDHQTGPTLMMSNTVLSVYGPSPDLNV